MMGRRFIRIRRSVTRKESDCKNDCRHHVDESSEDPHERAGENLVFKWRHMKNHGNSCVRRIEDAITKCEESSQCAAGQRPEK